MVLTFNICCRCGRDSVASIVTIYGLDGPGFETWWGQDFRTSPDRRRCPPTSCKMDTGLFPRVKRWGRVFDHATPLAPRLWVSIFVMLTESVEWRLLSRRECVRTQMNRCIYCSLWFRYWIIDCWLIWSNPLHWWFIALLHGAPEICVRILNFMFKI